MSLDDFCKCEYDEFESICKAWSDMTESRNRDAWERTRIMAAISIQPHIKNKITPKQLLPMPWDDKKAKVKKPPRLTAEEQRKRFERICETFQTI